MKIYIFDIVLWQIFLKRKTNKIIKTPPEHADLFFYCICHPARFSEQIFKKN